MPHADRLREEEDGAGGGKFLQGDQNGIEDGQDMMQHGPAADDVERFLFGLGIDFQRGADKLDSISDPVEDGPIVSDLNGAHGYIDAANPGTFETDDPTLCRYNKQPDVQVGREDPGLRRDNKQPCRHGEQISGNRMRRGEVRRGVPVVPERLSQDRPEAYAQ